jgi:hypothetical protein
MVQTIRAAMLQALKQHCDDHWEDLAIKVDLTPDIKSLWYLRPDLMHAISSCQGEAIAQQVLMEITPLFQGSMTKNKRHAAPLFKSVLTANTQPPRPEKFTNAMDWLRGLAVQASIPKDSWNAVSEHETDESAQSAVSQVESTPNEYPELELDATEHVPELTEAERAGLVVAGLDFLEAIAAHQKWKSRLAACVNDRSSERLDYRVVCQDDQCVLGHWIHGPGGDAYGHKPLFGQLHAVHAQFHLAAGSIVQLANEGKTQEARTALKHGEYSQCSIRVQGLISSLYLEFKQQTPTDEIPAAS